MRDKLDVVPQDPKIDNELPEGEGETEGESALLGEAEADADTGVVDDTDAEVDTIVPLDGLAEGDADRDTEADCEGDDDATNPHGGASKHGQNKSTVMPLG